MPVDYTIKLADNQLYRSWKQCQRNFDGLTQHLVNESSKSDLHCLPQHHSLRRHSLYIEKVYIPAFNKYR